MKLHVEFHYLAPDAERYACINLDEYDGAPDAGAQMVGFGPTEPEARADFMDQWMERECERDCQHALKFAQTWDMLLMTIFPEAAPMLHASSAGGRSDDLAPYTDIDEGREPKYESPESIHGVANAFR